MVELLSKLFIKNRENISDPAVRRGYGTMSGIVGIIANVLLFVGKFAVGTLTGSISISADAVNSLADAGTSVISLVSFKISSKPADRKHPFGHARIEYVASMIVAFIILLIGFELLKSSVGKIIEPTGTEFSIFTVIVLGVSVLVKLGLYLFNMRISKKIGSVVIKATATDSLSDAAATTAVLLSALISRFLGVDLDGYMGAVVAVMIMIAGVKVLNETKNSILGEAPDAEVVESIKRVVNEYPEALGIHDMVVHNYGPGRTIASLHVEVDGAENVFYTHDVIDNIEKRLRSELNVECTIHLDPIVTDDEEVTNMRALVEKTVSDIDCELKIHDFRFVKGNTYTNLIFDVVVPFECRLSDEEIKRRIQEGIGKIDENYFAVITIDKE